ncbi:MAG: hypothetical protein RLZZ292_3327 [Bacteroidota bacterium]|jgi:hypothetical protein
MFDKIDKGRRGSETSTTFVYFIEHSLVLRRVKTHAPVTSHIHTNIPLYTLHKCL